MAGGATQVAAAIRSIADGWRGARQERQARRSLDPADFAALRDAGFHAMVVPVEQGGRWESVATSARPLCEALRALAGGDSSVALVSAMHPAVIGYWLMLPAAAQPAWEAQRAAVFASAADGEQWGTITSEPGSGGDIMRTRSTATAAPDAEPFLVGGTYRVTGDKHFGSGSGIADRMMTTAVADGEDEPSIFVLDTRGRPWDGSEGYRLVAEWDGMGMAATQSHAMRLDGALAVRIAYDGPLSDVTMAAAPFVACLFTSVVLGVLDEAVRTARAQLAPKATELRAYEQVEWARAEQDHWVATQAFEGALRSLESGDASVVAHDALRAKQAVAEIAEDTLRRLTRVLGGGTYSRRSPFAHWNEDVRALGFLRPPWGLATDALFLTSF